MLAIKFIYSLNKWQNKTTRQPPINMAAVDMPRGMERHININKVTGASCSQMTTVRAWTSEPFHQHLELLGN